MDLCQYFGLAEVSADVFPGDWHESALPVAVLVTAFAGIVAVIILIRRKKF